MSSFDPFGIYHRETKKSHKGQIIRKKFSELPTVYTNEQLDNVISVLIGRGFRVFPPGVDPAAGIIQKLSHTFIYPNIDLGQYIYNQDSTVEFRFSDLWPNIKNDFGDILSIPNLRVKNLNFYTALVSFDFGTVQDIDMSTNAMAYMDINLSDVLQQQYNLRFYVRQNYLNAYGPNEYSYWCSSVNPNEVHVCQSAPSVQENSYEVKPAPYSPALSVPYLNYTERNQIATLTALRNDDFTVLNPLYLQWTLSPFTGSFSVYHHHLTVIVGLSIDYE